MKHEISPNLQISDEVYEAISNRMAVVALESTVITHGLPYPENLGLALDLEAEVRNCDAVPATIALIDGKVQVGLTDEELERLASGHGFHKISSRDIGPGISLRWSGGTTVAGTLAIANQVGIHVFATGGIGGVHRQLPGQKGEPVWDVSADLPQLAATPMILVCAGAKAILDLPATLEYLETWGVPVIGYQTMEFPAFYSIHSGLELTVQADSAQAIVEIARAHWSNGFKSGLLVANPPPQELALPYERVEEAIQKALKEAAEQGVQGQQVTPFLLSRMTQITHGESLKANLALLKNNARVGALIALAYASGNR